MTIRELAEQVVKESAAPAPTAVSAGAVLALLARGQRLTGREIAFGLGFGRDATIEAMAGGGVYAVLSQLLQARRIATDPATLRYFLRSA
jgi:hypothetical protein